MACVTGGCCSAAYYICLAAICIYLFVCILAVPQYRFVALMIFALVTLYATSAWRLLPSERLVVREMAEAMARQRCPLPAVAVPFTTPMTAGAAVTHPSLAFHEPYRGSI
ncbi:conserved hypothetical protein [Leishmania major strain Friedlin]|uniref:Uncharacterized protein n=1 Tax=Leishmania major TaxID=5664 RepID=E9ADK1_LEIMA|nr:conserved hypothetical protein [Leishmania major strain Friedlin]CAG9577310.1 hypothetical_protein_-_conserved [Leishmania major strain Friedlin]CBZ05853.1 conserved hypothetical protein [Leishmania major strain Friedlin]|eukprot:XP_003722073.1 conserved hypothetical protein [Leishmania major strain Friedlin]